MKDFRSVTGPSPEMRYLDENTTHQRVRITWNGMGGELDAITVRDDGDDGLTRALIRLVSGNIVSIGDTFEVRLA